jgi:hypothetical protein
VRRTKSARAAICALICALPILACGRRDDGATVRPDPSASARPSTAKTFTPPPPAPPPITRIQGDLAGGFSLRRRRVVAGEPVVVDLELRGTRGPLTIFVGGDQRNAANFPTRVAVRATDASGAVVCDSVAKPELMSFGGLGGDRTFKEGERYRDTFVLNPECGALGVPGDYHVTLHRRVTDTTLVTTLPGSTTKTSCDVYPVHEGALPAGLPAPCVAMMDARPSITSELDLHVDPFDAASVRRASEEHLRLASSATPPDEIGSARLRNYLCGWLSCGCAAKPPGVPLSDADVIGALPAKLPRSFPKPCAP